MREGTPEQGTPEQGTPEQGTPEQGTPEQGPPEQFQLSGYPQIDNGNFFVNLFMLKSVDDNRLLTNNK